MASKRDGSSTKVSRQRGVAATSAKPLKEKVKNSDNSDVASQRRAAAKPAESSAESASKSARSARSTAKAGAKSASGAGAAPEAKAATAEKTGRSGVKTRAAAARKPASPAASKAAEAKPARKTAAKTAEKPAKTSAQPKPRAAKPAAPRATATKVVAAPEKEVAEAASTRASEAVTEQAKPAAGARAEAAASATDAATDAMESAFARLMPGNGSLAAQNLTQNLERIETLSQRLVSAMSQRGMPNPSVEMPGPDLYVATAGAFMKTLTEQPSRIIGQQVNFWGETLKHYAQAQAALARGAAPSEDEEGTKDKRFKNPLWRSHPFFSFVRRQYEINAKAMSSATSDLDMPDETARRRLNWLTGQIIDMMAPTNFLATNPDALEKAVETEGESLVKGLENLVRDVEQNGGEMLVSLADRDAFTVGENIGTAEGTVVHRTPLLELIQYKPTTESAHALPLVIFPPWINKFYILDLKPQNSLIRWLVDQGHTLFVVSWKNPDASYAETGMDDYVSAYLDVFEKALTLTDQKKLNVVGYCIAGTTLSLTLALMAKRGDKRVNSATFFTTLTDFSDQGEFTTFLQDDFVDGIEAEVHRHGILRSQIMSRTMSFLRANDLVWGPAIRSYMMGETPPAFDLLFWNGDSTNLPAKMTIEYLRGLCQQNAFAGDGFPVLGEMVRLSDVTLPLCSVACETDHIAPWKDCWRGVAQMGSPDKRFILSESGHIAGIVNPPSKKKYGHYAGGSDFSHGDQGWKDSATFREGSWWPLWGEWLDERSGEMIPARDPGKGYGPAPGTYVHERGGAKSDD